ncbi:hypothetical protein SAMN04488038_10343 [Solimonas aquatica]|uniref:Uncharacterized protein n=1 Tax=Solimonas aquatica TaxID=489703 RepID=A0A1H9CGL9_9GAMM|nr:hypothetical protein [Solimonas aquatica]SEQ00201.1 hypothetical protein SAMN04488038_10343 [Solimonas aquatica]
MRPKRQRPSQYPAPVKVRRAPGTPTKNQLRAAAQAEARAVKEQWLSLLAPAKATWAKLHPQELAGVEGNFHKLAGLVQLRYQLSREESDRQVNAFFDTHRAPLAAAL